MCGHFGHLGHLTPKPQQKRHFFNLSKMANPQNLGHLGHLARHRPPALRTSASGVYPDVYRDGEHPAAAAAVSAMESVLSQGDESSPRVDVPARSRR